MQSSLSIIFYPRGNDVDKHGNAPIYARITVNGKRSEFSIRRKVALDKWSSEGGKIRGNSVEAREFNRYLTEIQSKVYRIQQELSQNGDLVTAIKIKNCYFGKEKVHKMLLEIFQEHNDRVEKLVGRDFAPGTLERYKTAKKHIANYILQEYKIKDIPVKEVDHQFISGFEYYLKTTRNCAHNSAIKYITNFKKIIRIAHANVWIDKDPFLHWKAKLKIVDREFLTEKELQILVEKEFEIDRLNQVKDIFVFCCFTGLAYADVKKLANNNLVLGVTGERWIKINRSKTDTRSNIPILSIPEAIIEKYKAKSDYLDTEYILPVLSNQKMNAYIKEIADLCGIQKNLTFHLARHTFATTVTLTNGVPMESVSKMLGHKSIKTTQHYAKIIDKKVSDDMKSLKDKLLKYSNQ
ncbi:site-specific integrase [Gelidibacter sp.]|uniref:site-specific integrase n=1 Tax=Gelidibacter sp. TaxID=2018083 RepID=UPI002C4EBBAE|nr:site-specific integrase [Gelidibacter sp.]HUH27141.1 site-specific integrase [Gelidibacter sp.]